MQSLPVDALSVVFSFLPLSEVSFASRSCHSWTSSVAHAQTHCTLVAFPAGPALCNISPAFRSTLMRSVASLTITHRISVQALMDLSRLWPSGNETSPKSSSNTGGTLKSMTATVKVSMYDMEGWERGDGVIAPLFRLPPGIHKLDLTVQLQEARVGGM